MLPNSQDDSERNPITEEMKNRKTTPSRRLGIESNAPWGATGGAAASLPADAEAGVPPVGA